MAKAWDCVWLAVLMAASAWAAEPQARRAPAAGRQRAAKRRRSAAPKLSDAQLEAPIRAKFAKSKINADKFTVRVQGGVATIDGKTDVVQHKGAATRMCKTAGAVAVDNRVQVSEAAQAEGGGESGTGPAPRASQTRGRAHGAKVERRDWQRSGSRA